MKSFFKALAIGAMTLFPLQAETVFFEEDFESYSDGENILNQNGWKGNVQTIANQSNYIGSASLNGFSEAHGSASHDMSYVDIVTNDMDYLIMEADFYAGTGGGDAFHTHNSGITLRNDEGRTMGTINLHQNPNSTNLATWRFIINTEPGQAAIFDLSQGIGLGTDTLVHAKIIWNEITKMVTGSVFFDGTEYSATTSYDGYFSVSNESAQLELLNDHRNQPSAQTGMEMDNISLRGAEVPEPGVVALGIMGLSGLIAARRKNKLKNLS